MGRPSRNKTRNKIVRKKATTTITESHLKSAFAHKKR